MISSRRIFVALYKSISFVQTRTIKVLPNRKPIAVYSKKDYETYLKQKFKQKRKIIKVAKLPNEKVIASPKTVHKCTVPSDLLQLKYKKLRNIPGNVINRMLYDMGTLRQRPNPYLCLMTNPQAIHSAFEAENFVKTIYFNRLRKLKVFPIEYLQSVHLTHIPDRLLKELPDSCEAGVFAVSTVQNVKTRAKVLSKRRWEDRKKLMQLIPLTVVCEGIRDAKEMGKILKTAESLGCEQVYTIENCIDVWNTEVLDISEGAHFKLPIITNLTWEMLEKLKYGKNFYMMHFNKMGLSLKDFVASKKFESYNKSSRIIDMLQQEGSDGTLTKGKESDFYLPPLDCFKANLHVSSMLVIGKVSMEAFHYAANTNFTNCYALNLPEDTLNSISSQLLHILTEAQRQRV